MSEQEHTPKQPTESLAIHEEKLEQAGPYITWKGEVSEEVEKSIDCTAEKLAKAAEMLGIPASELSDLAVMFYDKYSDQTNGPKITRGVSRAGVSLKQGDEMLHFKHGIAVYVRDSNGDLRSKEDIDAILFHELTHMRQRVMGDGGEGVYMKPKVQRRIRRAGQLAMGLPLSVAGAAGVEGANAAAKVYEVGENIMAAYEVAPHNTVAVLVLGAAAMGLTGVINYARDKNRPLKWLHKFDRRENEARRNEALAQEFSIITVD